MSQLLKHPTIYNQNQYFRYYFMYCRTTRKIRCLASAEFWTTSNDEVEVVGRLTSQLKILLFDIITIIIIINKGRSLKFIVYSRDEKGQQSRPTTCISIVQSRPTKRRPVGLYAFRKFQLLAFSFSFQLLERSSIQSQSQKYYYLIIIFWIPCWRL